MKQIVYVLVALILFVSVLLVNSRTEQRIEIKRLQAQNDSLSLELAKCFPAEVELNRYIITLEMLWSTDTATARKFYETLTNETE